MPRAVPIACSVARCPNAAVFRGRCDGHRQTTTQRGYGGPHQQARVRLAATLPTACGYCHAVVVRGETWVAAHRVDGDPSRGWMVAHPDCNERAKGGGDGLRRADSRSQMTRAPLSTPITVNHRG